MMSVLSESSFSIIPLDTRFHSFIRFFILPASIVGLLYMMIYDYADYNNHGIYIVEVMCLAIAIIMFSFSEIGFLQQERYACVTVFLGCVAVLVSNFSVAIITYNEPSMTELLHKNYAWLAIRIFLTALWASVVSVYYLKNRLRFYPREPKGNPDAISTYDNWADNESPIERENRENWIMNRLKNTEVESDEAPRALNNGKT